MSSGPVLSSEYRVMPGAMFSGAWFVEVRNVYFSQRYGQTAVTPWRQASAAFLSEAAARAAVPSTLSSP